MSGLNLIGRPTGPISLRLIIQSTMAISVGIRSGAGSDSPD